jgi:hypothetical protein
MRMPRKLLDAENGRPRLTTKAPVGETIEPPELTVSDDLPHHVPITSAELNAMLSFLGPEISALLDSARGADGATERSRASPMLRTWPKTKRWRMMGAKGPRYRLGTRLVGIG